MVNINLTQDEADALIAMPKIGATANEWDYPNSGCSICVPLLSQDRRENFLLDISRSRIDLLKGTYQTRGKQVVVLVRLDFGGSPHRNPDDAEVDCPHLHIYREGFGDKWAIPIPKEKFGSTDDLWQTLQDFMHYCNIIEPPEIQRGLLL